MSYLLEEFEKIFRRMRVSRIANCVESQGHKLLRSPISTSTKLQGSFLRLVFVQPFSLLTLFRLTDEFFYNNVLQSNTA